MSDGEALLAAICENPHDETARLVYADWLDEQGSERDSWQAAMIRGQWDTKGPARMVTTWPEFTPIHKAFRAAAHCGMEIDGVIHQPWLSPPGNVIRIRRGFAHAVACPVDQWLEHGPALVKLHPIEDVRLTDRRSHSPEGIRNMTSLRWAWYNCIPFPGIMSDTEQEDLPACIHDRLTGGAPLGRWHNFSTEDLANAALSRACLAWAKSEAVSQAPTHPVTLNT